MITTLDPRRDFQRDSKRASAHQDLMADPNFHAVLKEALLAYQIALCNGPAEAAIVAAHRLRGAQDFIHTLLNLGELKVPVVLKDDQALKPV